MLNVAMYLWNRCLFKRKYLNFNFVRLLNENRLQVIPDQAFRKLESLEIVYVCEAWIKPSWINKLSIIMGSKFLTVVTTRFSEYSWIKRTATVMGSYLEISVPKNQIFENISQSFHCIGSFRVVFYCSLEVLLWLSVVKCFFVRVRWGHWGILITFKIARRDFESELESGSQVTILRQDGDHLIAITARRVITRYRNPLIHNTPHTW